tara:strand:- start:188 stop:424 length:237 start_codon:yes stop_codon:yes gene_type:complete
MDQLINQFTTPDKKAALKNLKMMADKLQIQLQEVPRFLEEYADIYLPIAYGRDCLNALIPKKLSISAMRWRNSGTITS